MRIIFAGTPAVAVPTLRALIEAGHEIVAVVTRPDAPRGRKRVLTPSEVAVAADSLGLNIVKTNQFDEAMTVALSALNPDLGVVVAFGALLRHDALKIPRLGWINLHFSLLPAFRGAAPVQRNLLEGGPTGVTVFQLDDGMDTGPIWRSQELSVQSGATAAAVLEQFADDGRHVVLDAIHAISRHERPHPQDGIPTYASKLVREDGRLDCDCSVAENFARYRAVTPEPGAFIELPEGTLKVLEVAPGPDILTPNSVSGENGMVCWGCADGSLQLITVQPAGRSAMSASDWFRGRR